MSNIDGPLLARLALAAALGTGTVSGSALADPNDVRLYRTSVSAPRAQDETPFGEADLTRFRERLDDVLGEAVQDLGLNLDLSEQRTLLGAGDREDELVSRARDCWTISAELTPSGSKLRLRITAVAPGSSVLIVRSAEVTPQELEMRAALMTRDLVQAGRPREARPSAPPPETIWPETAIEPHSSGRAVLALNAAVLGAYVGFSIQRASGSEDERLTYPLVALGAGIGLGGSMLVADEWDIGVGDAWYLSAGTWWPTSSGLLLAQSYEVPEEDRYVYGLIAASAGLTLGTVALSFESMNEGDAVIAHSGGALGLALGGMTELMIQGRTDESPIGGMGYGAAIGVVAAGTLATQVDVPASRVLLIDLGASLGALTGAAAASPLLLVDEDESETRTRLWLASIGAGTLIGGGLAWWMTREARPQSGAGSGVRVLPYATVVPEASPREPSFVDIGVRGAF